MYMYTSVFSCIFSVPSDAPLTDCTALNDAGFSITGLYKVFPGDAEGEFTVFCDMDLLSGGWTIIQRRVDDSQSFDNNWDEYRNGFGDFNGNFWLGLHKIKRITDMGNYELYIGLEDFIARTVYSRYSSFSLGSEQSNYKLAIGAFQEAPVSTGGDSFSSHNTDPFSTPDKDNDVSSAHCAGLYKAGWWYKECHDSNLNGVYYPTGQIPGASHGIIWESWLTEFKPVKTAVMAVRRS